MKLRHIGAKELVLSGSWFLICFAAVAVCAWLLGWRWFVEIIPGAPVMALDTALCFFLTGTAVLSALKGAQVRARMLGALVTSLGIAYLAAAMEGTWLSVHRLVPYMTAAIFPPGFAREVRMAGDTAAVFIVLGITILLLASPRPSRIALSAAALLATVATAMGILGWLTLLAEIWDGETWSKFAVEMALPSAICACAAGMTNCALFWLRSRATSRQLSTMMAMLATLCLLLLAAGVDSAILANTTILDRTRSQIGQTEAQIHAIGSIVESVRKAETGQRGYLLTSEDKYLAEYELGRAGVRDGFRELATAKYRGPALNALHTLVTDKLNELAETVALERNGDHDKALTVVKSDRGLLLMEAIDLEGDKLIRNLQGTLEDRLQASSHSLDTMQRAVLWGYVLALGGVGFGARLLRREMRRRSSVEKALRKNERELEHKIEARTAALKLQTAALQTEMERRSATEKALRETSDRLRLALSFSKVAVWTWSVEEDSVVWSGHVEEIFGISADRLCSYAAFRDCILLQDRDMVDTKLRTAAENRSEYTAEFRIVLPNGEVRWVAGIGGALYDEHGRLVQMAGVNYDISGTKAAQERIAASERRFRQLAEAMPQIVWTANGYGKFEYYNSKWYEVTGFPSSVKPSAEERVTILHPEDRERWLRVWAEAMETRQPYEIEYRFWDAGHKEYRWYLGRAVPIRSTRGKVIRWFGTCTDIHQGKLAELQALENERALRLREEQLAAIFETGVVGDWTWDIANNEVHAHPGVWKLWGAPEGQASAPANWFRERTHPADVRSIDNAMQAALRGERALDFEYRIVQPDGSLRWLSCIGAVLRDANGSPIGTRGLNVDITERKVAELRVQESERQLREQADAMPQIVWTANANGVIEYYNRQWFAYTGTWDESTSALDRWTEFVHADDLSNWLEVQRAAMAEGRGFEVECRLKRGADGYYRWHLARCVPYRNEGGMVLRWFGTCTDIHEQKTERERLESEVQIHTRELRRSLLEKETLLKEVHHRVKNNLQVISSLLRMQCDSVDDPAAAEALKESQQRVLSMALIHERLYGSQQMSEIDFGEYTRTLVNELFSSYSGRTAHVVSRVVVSPVRLNIDQAIPCGLILNELITNALKYAYPDDTPGEVSVNLSETSTGAVTLSVSDQGQGLPDGFDWKNTKSMGLPIVDILAKQVGGSLKVRSRPGAAFTVEFPKDTRHVVIPAA